ncbi:MAG: hypothetical protein JNG89_15675 [Planctomycetaceae bacterium]|nr:hypothetical protein [Planctomycetaceae bacterium]
MWQWLVVLGLAALIWRYAGRSGDCVIRIRRGQVTIRGKVAAGRRAEIERFLQEQFPDVPRLRIDVSFRRSSRPLRVRIRGPISGGERQLIRNFFTTTL